MLKFTVYLLLIKATVPLSQSVMCHAFHLNLSFLSIALCPLLLSATLFLLFKIDRLVAKSALRPAHVNTQFDDKK